MAKVLKVNRRLKVASIARHGGSRKKGPIKVITNTKKSTPRHTQRYFYGEKTWAAFSYTPDYSRLLQITRDNSGWLGFRTTPTYFGRLWFRTTPTSDDSYFGRLQLRTTQDEIGINWEIFIQYTNWRIFLKACAFLIAAKSQPNHPSFANPPCTFSIFQQ